MTLIFARQSLRDRKGQAIVEFALVLPVFMLMLFGAIEFGRAYYDLHLLTTSAREGARVGVLPGKVETDVQNAVSQFLQSVSLSGGWTQAVTVKDVSGTTRTGGLAAAIEGDRVYVTVNYSFHVLAGRILPGFTGTVQLHGKCVMRHE
jgi:Flp pilus assembly protein TadG